MNASRFPTTAFDEELFVNPYPNGIQHHYWTVARMRIVHRHLRAMIDSVDELILDIGCGRGIMVEWLRNRGLQTIGCDLGTPLPISESVVPYVQLGIEAEALSQELRDRVRVVLLLDVLEHLPQPAAFVKRLFELYSNCDKILVTLPARQELWSNYDEYYGHRLRYDQAAITRLSQEAGCKLLQRRIFFSLPLSSGALAGMAQNRKTAIMPPRGVAVWIHRMIALAFIAEERLLPRSLPGTSILALISRTIAPATTSN